MRGRSAVGGGAWGGRSSPHRHQLRSASAASLLPARPEAGLSPGLEKGPGNPARVRGAGLSQGQMGDPGGAARLLGIPGLGESHTGPRLCPGQAEPGGPVCVASQGSSGS